MRRLLRLLCVAGLVVLPQVRAEGIDVAGVAQADSEGLSLQQALIIALKKNPNLQIGATNVTANEGALQSAGGAFDPLVQADATLTEAHNKSRTASSSVGVVKQLRSGVKLSTSLTSQTLDSFDSTPTYSSSSVGINIIFPMLRGQGEEFAAAGETSARLVLESSQYDLRHATSSQIYSTAAAYWNLRAAEDVLAAQWAAEARAEKAVSDIQRLIEMDERPASDIAIIQANLLNKRTARINAEQIVIRARMAFGVELGLDYPELATIKGVADSFPAFNVDPVLIEDITPLVEAGLSRRLDLKAANTYLDALKVAVNSARDQLKPILDFSVGVNHGGNTLGTNPVKVFIRGDGDPQVSATLRYVWDVENNTSKGQLLSQSAAYDQQSISIRALRLSIGAAIENAVAVYNRSARQLVESQNTVALYTRIVRDERTKLQLGRATLLDVVNVETQRQEAVISNIGQHLAYANAIASLRFELGELISDQAQTDVVPVDRLFFIDDEVTSAP